MSKKYKTLLISFSVGLLILLIHIVYLKFILKPELGEDIWISVTVSSYEPRGVLKTVYTFEVDTNRTMKIVRGKENIHRTKPSDDWLTDERIQTLSLSKHRYEKLQSLAQKAYDYPLESSMPNIDPAPNIGWEIHGTVYDKKLVGYLLDKNSYSDFGNNEFFLDLVKELSKYGSGKIENLNQYIQ